MKTNLNRTKGRPCKKASEYILLGSLSKKSLNSWISGLRRALRGPCATELEGSFPEPSASTDRFSLGGFSSPLLSRSSPCGSRESRHFSCPVLVEHSQRSVTSEVRDLVSNSHYGLSRWLMWARGVWGKKRLRFSFFISPIPFTLNITNG